MSDKPCFFADKGCKKTAKFRVILGGGIYIDVCEEHVEGYRGLGLKIIKLEKVKT